LALKPIEQPMIWQVGGWSALTSLTGLFPQPDRITLTEDGICYIWRQSLFWQLFSGSIHAL
jgi:hypothetical protein